MKKAIMSALGLQMISAMKSDRMDASNASDNPKVANGAIKRNYWELANPIYFPSNSRRIKNKVQRNRFLN